MTHEPSTTNKRQVPDFERKDKECARGDVKHICERSTLPLIWNSCVTAHLKNKSFKIANVFTQ